MKTKKETFDYKTITSYEVACDKLKLNPDDLPDVSKIPEELRKSIIACYKLMIIFNAINNGWIPDWSNRDQPKCYPWFYVLSSGLGFDASVYHCDSANARVGARLCTDKPEKAIFMATQFESEFKDWLLI